MTVPPAPQLERPPIEIASILRESSRMIDPLSAVLRLVEARCSISGRLIAGGSWTHRFQNLDAIKLCAAVKGSAWWRLEGSAEAAPFRAGDILVMNGTRSLILASSAEEAVAAQSIPLGRDDTGSYRIGRGDDFEMVAGLVVVDERCRALLLTGLPPALIVGEAAQGADTLRWLLDQLVRELMLDQLAGRDIVTAELAQLLFVTVLRAYLVDAPPQDHGWLKGLGDSKLAPIIGRLHADPANDWSVEKLAGLAGMSRTTFAVRFREVMGVPPLTYLTTWRMHVAERGLRAGLPITQVAESVGYSSESAFSNAFKRTMGVAPGQRRRGYASSGDDNAGSLDGDLARAL